MRKVRSGGARGGALSSGRWSSRPAPDRLPPHHRQQAHRRRGCEAQRPGLLRRRLTAHDALHAQEGDVPQPQGNCPRWWDDFLLSILLFFIIIILYFHFLFHFFFILTVSFTTQPSNITLGLKNWWGESMNTTPQLLSHTHLKTGGRNGRPKPHS